MKPVLLKTDGSSVLVEPKSGDCFSLEELQEMVGGYIELVRLFNGQLLIVDEDGLAKRLEENVQGTLLCKMFGCGDYIFGDALYCDSDMIK